MVLRLKTHYSIQISVFRKGFYLNMENYIFVLTPANRKVTPNYCKLEEKYHIFTIAAQNCNNGITFSRSGKKITIQKIESNQIELILSSDSTLPSPSRSLSAFSRELIRLNEESHCLTDAIYNHTLFQTQLINMKKDINSTKEITEAELIVAITNLLFKPSNYNSMYRSNTINKLKELMLPFIR